jgi:hypothetical protein
VPAACTAILGLNDSRLEEVAHPLLQMKNQKAEELLHLLLKEKEGEQGQNTIIVNIRGLLVTSLRNQRKNSEAEALYSGLHN